MQGTVEGAAQAGSALPATLNDLSFRHFGNSRNVELTVGLSFLELLNDSVEPLNGLVPSYLLLNS